MGYLLATLLVAGVIFLLLNAFFNRPNKDEGVDVNKEVIDGELIGPVSITRQVPYPGTRLGESGHAIARYDTTYGDGKPRVSKWILASKLSYLTPTGHNVLYQYFREDGTLEHDRLVHPEPGLGGGVYVKERLRTFDTNNEQLEELYFRQDGTLGVRAGMKSGLFQKFRKDGKTLRYEQISVGDIGDNKVRQIWYKRDGKTVWMERDVDGSTHVSFDLAGNPVDLNFTSEGAIGSYSMGQQSQPVLIAYNKYTRPDGTLAYKQTWYDRWDNAANTTADTLGAVIVYDATGTRPVAEYTLDLRAASQPRFIKQAALHNPDGTTLVRKYRSPDCRLSEDILEGHQTVIGHKDFTAGDRFQEVVDDIIFQGFTHDVWGLYDDETHDI
jgi:hypothetical protein